jgi:hypothetical protein
MRNRYTIHLTVTVVSDRKRTASFRIAAGKNAITLGNPQLRPHLMRVLFKLVSSIAPASAAAARFTISHL